MTKSGAGLLRMIATRSVIAAIPVAVASAYASNLFLPVPPRTAAYAIEQVVEITVSPTTVGIAASTLYGQTKAQIDAQVDEMQALGVENIRVFVPWAFIEFNPVSPQTVNQYYWDSIDLVMAAAKERDMGVLAEVNSTPYWAAADGNTSFLGTATPAKVEKADESDEPEKSDTQASKPSEGSPRHSENKGDKGNDDAPVAKVMPKTGSDRAGSDKGSQGKKAPSSQGGSGSDGGGDEG